ncbi:hypothetical protein PIB30_090816 [Stylosanthes scabra]|uniref:Uncharacterized protein n=1 Tax=Stylosanthes scabra TaxID=79078 RepID=A0ABU6WSR9_9FABA|nr:hypothetical protein [Stylosanthes scabra]
MSGKALQDSKTEELNKEIVKSTSPKLTKEVQDPTMQQPTSVKKKENHIPFPQQLKKEKIANQYSLCQSIGTNAPLCQVHEGFDLKEEEFERRGNHSAGK